MKRSCALLAVVVGVLLGATSCRKQEIKRNINGSYSRTAPGEIYTDSTSQLLLNCEAITIVNENTLSIGGNFSSETSFSYKKLKKSEPYDIELMISPDWSKWLPSNYVWNGSDYVNSVNPDQTVLSNTSFFMNVSDDEVELIIKYPNYTDHQLYKRI